ncbi:MAG: excisionase family DNA binding protein [Clostridium sp.]|jgi:excisionase family DNA binding protein
MEVTKEQLKEIIRECIQPPKAVKLTLTIKEAAEISGIGREKLTELTFTNDFPSFKVGIKTLINREMFMIWLKKITVERKIL